MSNESQIAQAPDKKEREVQITLTSKELIRQLKKAQEKHGVFIVAGLCSKTLLNGHLKPAELTLLKMREDGNKLNHVLLVDRHAANLITGNKEAIVEEMEKEIIEEAVKEVTAEDEATAEKEAEQVLTEENEEVATENVAQFPKKGSEANPLGY